MILILYRASMSDEKQITDYIFATKHQVQCKKTTFGIVGFAMFALPDMNQISCIKLSTQANY